MKKKKKAFTLVELLAVIVILAIILVIAIPQIMKVIKAARLSSIKDSAMLIAEQAEKDYLSQQVLNKDYNASSIPCDDVAKLNDDYEGCTITYNNGIATVTLSGTSNGKFAGITCTGTKDNMTCTEESSSLSNYVYAFGEINDVSEGVEDYTQLRDPNNNQRPTFIRFNKSNLSEKYVCTMYDSTKADGFGTEPHCLLSFGAYSTRNEPGSQWNQVKALFGTSNCNEDSNMLRCDVNTSTSSWICEAGKEGDVNCDGYNNSSVAQCGVYSFGAHCDA